MVKKSRHGRRRRILQPSLIWTRQVLSRLACKAESQQRCQSPRQRKFAFSIWRPHLFPCGHSSLRVSSQIRRADLSPAKHLSRPGAQSSVEMLRLLQTRCRLPAAVTRGLQRGLCTVTPAAWRKYESGLRFRDLNSIADESAALAEDGMMVSVHYTGRLASDNTVFDTSLHETVDTMLQADGLDAKGWDRGNPLYFQLGAGEVIQGWDEGVHGMRVGQRRELEVPPDLAYGDEGGGDKIPPGATLIFEVELLEVNEPTVPTLWERIFGRKDYGPEAV